MTRLQLHICKDAYKITLSDVGCTQPTLDDHDVRIISETLNGTYSVTGSKAGISGMADREGDAGNWEVYPDYVRARNWDSGQDGLPDWWEKTFDLNPNSPSGDFSGSNGDPDKDGYTNLEQYLHWMDNPHYFMNHADSITIDLAEYTRGFINSPVFEILTTQNGTCRAIRDRSKVTFTATSEGFGNLEFKVQDADGTCVIKKIGFFKGQIPADSLVSCTYMLNRSETVLVMVDSVNTYKNLDTLDNTLPNHFSNMMDVVIYPNPVENILYINLDNRKNSAVNLDILDLTGQILIRRKNLMVNELNPVSIEISTLQPGMYLLNINNYNLNISSRFLKK